MNCLADDVTRLQITWAKKLAPPSVAALRRCPSSRRSIHRTTTFYPRAVNTPGVRLRVAKTPKT
eukprot:11276698-Alexandrium_andersonii.AAC.1